MASSANKMSNVCIPKIEATKLINSLKGDGISKLQAMKSPERRAFFEKSIGKELASEVNAAFEKAIVKNTRQAMVEFAKKVSGLSGSAKRDVIQKIQRLEDNKLLDGNILEDYVSRFLGANITEKEIVTLKAIAKKGADAEENLTKEFQRVISEGKITKEYTDALIAQAKFLKESDDFLIGKTANDWSSTIWNNMKASMLFNPASWGINIESNIVMGVMSAIERRIKNLRLTGHSSDLARDWRKTMLAVRKETGYDLSRALSIDELMQKQVIGEKMNIGKDNLFTKFIYQGALGTPDAWGGRLAFADALDLETTNIAKSMGLGKEKARELFLDAIQVVPKTQEGILARKIAVQEAQIATWTQPGLISNATLKLKAGLNKMMEEGLGIKGFKLGDMIEPFVKTPANIVAYGMDASALGVVRGAGKFVKLGRNYKLLTEVQRKQLLGEAMRDSMRTGMGVGGALVMASFIDDDDFVGAYDPNRYKFEELRHSNSNSIRIGGKWYSLDYAAGFAAPLIAVLYARKYGEKNIAKMTGQYFVGVANQVANVPFVGSFWDIGAKVIQNVNPDDPNAKEKTAKVIYNAFSDQVTSRVPGVLINMGKLFDDKERKADGFIQTLQSKVPFWRNSLPSKQDILGQDVLTEMAMSKNGMDKYIAAITQIAAGARIKTAKDTPYSKEIVRLKDAGNAPSFTSWKYRLGKRQEALKEKLGEEEYNKVFRDEYGKKMTEKISEKVGKEEYKNLPDEDKKKVIDNINDNVIEEIYKKYKIPLRDEPKAQKNKAVVTRLSK